MIAVTREPETPAEPMAAVRPMRVLIALPGLHRVNRGAEIALESMATQLSAIEGCDVTLMGSGQPRDGQPYRFLHAACTPRERFIRYPHLPVLRNEYVWEEATFVRQMRRVYDPADYDVTITCSYPFTNWLLRRRRVAGRRPPHVFVTQNGDWPAVCRRREYRWFACDGLVCTNPQFLARNRERWRCALIPNGVDTRRFSPGEGDRAALGLPVSVPVVLMCAALIASKRIIEGIRCVAAIDGVHLLVAGDGPMREQIEQAGRALMGDRFHRAVLSPQQMPMMYRSVDALLHMSLDEPFGNVYVEALATGLPIVTHDREATRWMLEDTSLLVDTTSDQAVAAALRDALSLKDESQRERRRDLALKRYAWPIVAQQYHRFLQQVMSV